MGMRRKREITNDLLVEVVKCIDATGVQGTINTLRKSRAKIDFVTDMVGDEFGVPVSEFIKNRTSTTHERHCLLFSSYYLNSFARLSSANIARVIERDKAQVIRFITEMETERGNKKSVMQKHFEKFDALCDAQTQDIKRSNI